MEILSLNEARVLGVLIEKENILPGYYPLTLNSVKRGCNQKTNRHPIMHIFEADVLNAIRGLQSMGLVSEYKTRNGFRYSHNVAKVFHIANQAVPLLGILLLRGQLTPSEMRLNVDRIYKFDNISTIKGLLLHMSRDREEPLVSPLPRQRGEREIRWTQLLTGDTVEKTEKPEMSIREMMDMVFDLQRRIRELEEDALVRSK